MSNDVWAKKNRRPKGCAAFRFWLRCSSVTAPLRGMLPRRASPEPKIDATNVVVFMKRSTKVAAIGTPPKAQAETTNGRLGQKFGFVESEGTSCGDANSDKRTGRRRQGAQGANNSVARLSTSKVQPPTTSNQQHPRANDQTRPSLGRRPSSRWERGCGCGQPAAECRAEFLRKTGVRYAEGVCRPYSFAAFWSAQANCVT